MLLEGSTALCIANRTTVLTQSIETIHVNKPTKIKYIIALEVHFFCVRHFLIVSIGTA
jgi:hypothetical protein